MWTQNCAHSERASEQSVTGLTLLRVQQAAHLSLRVSSRRTVGYYYKLKVSN